MPSDRATGVAIRAATLVSELRAELNRRHEITHLIWRIRTWYHPRLVALWREASLLPGVGPEQYLPDSVRILNVTVRGVTDSVYTMFELTVRNTEPLVEETIERLRCLAEVALPFNELRGISLSGGRDRGH